jgi:hypothetical protein
MVAQKIAPSLVWDRKTGDTVTSVEISNATNTKQLMTVFIFVSNKSTMQNLCKMEKRKIVEFIVS